MEKGKKLITAVLQLLVDKNRSVWLCARDTFNSGSPVYVSNVPKGLLPGTVIVGEVMEDGFNSILFREVVKR